MKRRHPTPVNVTPSQPVQRDVRSRSSRAMRARLYGALVLCGGVQACGEGKLRDSRETVAMTFWNRSQFTIDRLSTHISEHYGASEDVLAEPLAPEAHITVGDFRAGFWVTFERVRDSFGEPFAVTSSTGIEAYDDFHTLILFDKHFRLLGPGSASNPFGDGSDAAAEILLERQEQAP